MLTTTESSTCVGCAHWESKDGLVGWCEELAEALRLNQEILVHGLLPVQTRHSGRCNLLEPLELSPSEMADQAWDDRADDWRKEAA